MLPRQKQTMERITIAAHAVGALVAGYKLGRDEALGVPNALQNHTLLWNARLIFISPFRPLKRAYIRGGIDCMRCMGESKCID